MSLLEEFASAIERNDSTQVDLLLASGSIDVNARLPRPTNPPPLVLAAKRKHPAIVERLLNAGARIDDAEDGGWTACHYGIEHYAVIALLVKHRPNLDIKEKRNNLTPLKLTLGVRDENISVMLINAGASLDDTPEARLCGFAATCTAAIEALLKRGVVVGQLRGHEDWTPLHSVAIMERWWADSGAVVNMLVNVCGVDVNARSSNGTSCLQLATSMCNWDAMRCFINAGADLNSLKDARRPMLHLALSTRDKMRNKCVTILIAGGADVDASDHRGETACQLDNTSWALPAFMAAGADLRGVNPLDIAGVTLDQVEEARREIAKERLDFVRRRALQVCIGLQPLEIDALQTCEILVNACGPVAPLVAFHHWWAIATTVKHFRD